MTTCGQVLCDFRAAVLTARRPLGQMGNFSQTRQLFKGDVSDWLVAYGLQLGDKPHYYLSPLTFERVFLMLSATVVVFLASSGLIILSLSASP